MVLPVAAPRVAGEPAAEGTVFVMLRDGGGCIGFATLLPAGNEALNKQKSTCLGLRRFLAFVDQGAPSGVVAGIATPSVALKIAAMLQILLLGRDRIKHVPLAAAASLEP